MRAFISDLDESDQILTISRQVDPKFQVAAITHKVQESGNEAILFKNVTGTRFPVVTNLYGSRERLAKILGSGVRDFCSTWADVTSRPCEALDVADRGHVPALEHGNVSDLPQIWYSADDGGPYITGGVYLARHPITGVPNLSFHRSMYINDHELRARLAPRHHLTVYHGQAEALGKPLEAAILIGASPQVFLAAAARVPYDQSELTLAEQLTGAHIPMRPCQEIDLEVPADTQIVIEGRLLPNVRRPEGPFGEFMGYYVPVTDNAVFEVLNVSWINEAAFHSINCGSSEEVLPLGLMTAAAAYKHLARQFQGIADVAYHPAGNHMVIQLVQQYKGQPADVLRSALEEPIRCRMCSVVDDDVDIYDLRDVMWAILTRAVRGQSVITRPPVPSFFHDPQQNWGRFAIDACFPYGRQAEFKRKRIPGINDIRVADFLE